MVRFLILASAVSASAHMALYYPPPLKAANNPHTIGKPDNFQHYPHGCCERESRAPFPCRGHLKLLTTPEGAPVVSWPAGSLQYWAMYAPPPLGSTHYGGSAQVGTSDDQGKTFRVLASYLGELYAFNDPRPTYPGNVPRRDGGRGPENQQFPVRIPADHPLGRTVFAWSWTNREQETFMNCAVVNITERLDYSDFQSTRMIGATRAVEICRLAGSSAKIHSRPPPVKTHERQSPEKTHQRQFPEKTHERQSSEKTHERQSPEKTRQRQSPEKTRQRQSPEKTRQRQSPEKTHERQSSEKTHERQSQKKTHERQSPEKMHERPSSAPNWHNSKKPNTYIPSWSKKPSWPASPSWPKKHWWFRRDTQDPATPVQFSQRPEMFFANVDNGCYSPKTNWELQYPNPGPIDDVVPGDCMYPLDLPCGSCGRPVDPKVCPAKTGIDGDDSEGDSDSEAES